MKERPILFKADMVRAILNTKPGVWPAEPIDPKQPFKFQTRRLPGQEYVNTYPGQLSGESSLGPLGYRGLAPSDYYIKNKRDYRQNPGLYHWFLGQNGNELNPIPVKCPYGVTGDRLWARETFHAFAHGDPSQTGGVKYRADNEDYEVVWRPSIHMPRWASRLDLEIKDIRVERVQEIGDRDVIAEGACIEWPGPGPEPYQRTLWAVYSYLWDRINGKAHPWRSNPHVWVIEFMRLK